MSYERLSNAVSIVVYSVFSVRMGCLRTYHWRVHLTSGFCVHVDDSPLHFHSGDIGKPWFPHIFFLYWSLLPLAPLVSPYGCINCLPQFLYVSLRVFLSSFKTRDSFQTSEEFVLVPHQKSQKLNHCVS